MKHLLRSLAPTRLWWWTLALLLASGPAWAQTGAMACSGSAAAVGMRSGGVADRGSDLLITCTGGTPTGSGQNVLPADITLTFNTTVTSRLLAAGWLEALLVIDEPSVSSQLACATSSGLCTMSGTGTGVGTYNGSAGRFNVFQGALLGSNSILWRGIPLDPPGSAGQRRLRFTNLRLLSPAGGTVQVTFDMSGQTPINVTNTTQALGSPQAAFTQTVDSVTSVDGRLTGFALTATEGAAAAFKALSAAGPTSSTQAGPGGVPFDYETGFFNPALPSTVRGNLSLAGLPSNGTRVRVQLFSVPTSATVSAPLTINLGSTGVARLVSTDAQGAGTYLPASSTTLFSSGGSVYAVYEITQASSSAIEALRIPFTITHANGAPLFSSLQGEVSLAPLTSVLSADAASPRPRFTPTNAFQVAEPLRITTTSLPAGLVGSGYSQTITATGGAAPYSFSTNPAALPAGLTFSTAGVLAGTPTAAGSFSVPVTVTDSGQQASTKTFSLQILTSGPLQTSETSLEFTAPQAGDPPPARSVLITSAQPQPFVITVDGGSVNSAPPAWIQVSPPSGNTPALLTVKVDQGTLPAGTYTARIRAAVSGNANLISEITVKLIVTPAPQKLSALPGVVKFNTRAGDKRASFILLRNTGGGGPIPIAANIVDGSKWIMGLTPVTGSAGPGKPALLRVEIDSTGLAPGNYRDRVRITSKAGGIDVPVILRVWPPGPILDVSATGLRASMRQGFPPAGSREIRVLNRDAGSTLQWTAELIRGADYFAITPATGSATQSAPGSFRVAIRPSTSGLPAGTYPGIIRVSAPGASGSPRYVTMVLDVQPLAQPPTLDLSPGGLIFNGPSRGLNPLSQTAILTLASGSAVPYVAAASTADGGDWLTVTPTAASVSAGATDTLTITVNPRNLSAGVYTGEITVATATDSETLAVTAILTDPAADVPATARAATCVPTTLVLTASGLANNFSVPAGWPASLSADVRDNCGAAVSSATVLARFTNGDPPLPLLQEGASASYSTTWQPGTALAQTNVTLEAAAAGFPAASVTLIGGVTANAVPKLYRNGTIHNLDPKLGGLLSPGLVVQIYGEGLAGVAESTGTVPLQTDYKGTSVLIGPYQAPLYYVSPGQLVAQLPYELPPNTSYPILVVANNQVTIPDEVDVVSVQPGVAQFPDATLIAQHGDFSLVTSGNPAKRNEFLIMYLVGLGATNPTVVSGAPSPGTPPLGVPLVQPQVTVGGIPAEVAFYGLTPFGVGLYQINFRVPPTAPLNTPLQVVVTQGDYTANVTTLNITQ